MSVFLHVYGDDGSVGDFDECSDKAEKTYLMMIDKGVEEITVEEKSLIFDEWVTWNAEILKFGFVDKKFFEYIKSRYMDFHRTCHKGLYLISE